MTIFTFFKDKDDNWKSYDEHAKKKKIGDWIDYTMLKLLAEKKDAEEEKLERDFRQVGKILERYSK